MLRVMTYGERIDWLTKKKGELDHDLEYMLRVMETDAGKQAITRDIYSIKKIYSDEIEAIKKLNKQD